ncbi:type II toxin-antitoxin system YafQ family toxin [Conchiformibius kuhniae]|uniref:Type II toxin-antitoxin system YafQ family toxin n=1 Tax=Conchiformibius kuhniae TaxID=211502 RepID=A0A8T9MTL9_9NEIS|nr:type II toxin-antitoxin system YafQ family toxin [Conchiformibius kuhniae]UOP04947.1 type II toxin-antitoxin system YafQ family toxin [Conchiformibius kuhniae]
MGKPVTVSNQFKRDLRKQYLLLVSTEWAEVLNTLANDGILPEKYRNHPLKGNYAGYWECHIRPDLLLIYKSGDDGLFLARLGTHADLF